MNLNLISKKRGELMGISIISIMIFHFTEDYIAAGGNNPVVSLYYLGIGSVGVDIFLFLSGIGLYHSYTYNRDTICFYKKRLKRILKPYLFLGGLFWLVKDIFINHQSVHVFFSDFFLITFWTEGNKNLWFVSLIIILYLLFPAIYNVYYRKGKMKIYSFVMSIALISIANIVLNYINGGFQRIEIAVTRIPIFCFGVFLGYFIMNKTEIPVRHLIAFVVLVIVLQTSRLVLDYPLLVKRYTMGLWAVVLVLVISGFLDVLISRWICEVLKKIGEYSFELYLSHVGLRTIYNLLGKPTYILRNYVWVILMSFILSYTAKKILNMISK